MEFLWGVCCIIYITCAFILTVAASFEYLAAIPFAGLLFLLTIVGWWISHKRSMCIGKLSAVR